MRTIVIAAGDGERWGDYTGVPKHLVTLAGERLIDRTARLFSEHGEVYVVGRDERYETPYSQLVVPRLNAANFGADKFLSSRDLWNPDGRTIVAYGDVWFTEDAVARITGYDLHIWRLFARFGPSLVYGGDRGECFAQSFWPEHQAEHLAALRRIVGVRRAGVLREIGGWTHYRAMEGFFLVEHAQGPLLFEIDDETDDLDYPVDYERVRAAVEQLVAA